jgi:regulatory protein
VIDGLRRVSLVSDERFTEMLVQARRTRGFGPLWIKKELQEKGVAGELIDQWLDISGREWTNDIRRVRQKKFGAKLPKDFAERARQMRFLQYRGFTHDQIQHAFGRDDD